MQILRAAEDYLEAMLMMQQKHGYIRSIDIAEQLGVTKPSVTYTTKRLRENGYITMDRDGLITLTPSGMDIASRMLDRHHTLTKFLMELGVDAKTAEEDACKMEHDISEQTYTALCRHAIGKLGILGENQNRQYKPIPINPYKMENVSDINFRLLFADISVFVFSIH